MIVRPWSGSCNEDENSNDWLHKRTRKRQLSMNENDSIIERIGCRENAWQYQAAVHASIKRVEKNTMQKLYIRDSFLPTTGNDERVES